MINNLNKSNGFSLVELLVALGIGTIMTTATFNFYIGQSKSYKAQERVTEMQQNIRTAINLMTKEIRMAGYDPTGSAGAGITSANSNSLSFTMDLNENGIPGDLDEDITLSLYIENGIQKLGRITPADSNQPVALAEHIEAIGFAYAFDTDDDGVLETDNSHLIWAIEKSDKWYDLDTNDDGKIDSNDNVTGGEDTGISVDLDDIRAVRIWALIRTSKAAENYTNTKTYIVGNQIISPGSDADSNNNNRRMRLIETICKIRNMAM